MKAVETNLWLYLALLAAFATAGFGFAVARIGWALPAISVAALWVLLIGLAKMGMPLRRQKEGLASRRTGAVAIYCVVLIAILVLSLVAPAAWPKTDWVLILAIALMNSAQMNLFAAMTGADREVLR